MAEVALRAFLSIEASLAQRLTASWEKRAERLATLVTEAVAAGDFVRAHEIVNEAVAWDEVVDENEQFVELMLTEALLYGATRIVSTEELDLSIFPPDVIDSAKRLLKHSLSIDAVDTLKRELDEIIELEKRRTLEKSDRVFKSDLFDDAVSSVSKSVGHDMALINSSLTSSRVASYGFMLEATMRNVTVYTINEQMDIRICPVCETMHGKTFRVEQAREHLQKAVNAQSPDELKQIAPWPKQTKEALRELRNSSMLELVNKGFATPPYHPLCRGVLDVSTEEQFLQDRAEETVLLGLDNYLTRAEQHAMETFVGMMSEAQLNQTILATGLPRHEAAALRAYSGGSYGPINMHLRGKLSPDTPVAETRINAVLKSIDNLLPKLAPPTSDHVYRDIVSTRSFGDLLSRYSPGEVISDSAYISTATRGGAPWSILQEPGAQVSPRDMAFPTAGQRMSDETTAVFLKIKHNGVARALPFGSTVYDESEALFPRGTRFRVMDISHIHDGMSLRRVRGNPLVNDVLLVYMEAVPPDG